MDINRIKLSTYAIVADAKFFEEHRQKTLDAINDWPMLRKIETPGSHISKSDYTIPESVYRPYAPHVEPVLEGARIIIENEFGWDKEVIVPQCVWTQQYESKDNHCPHVHMHTTFTCVWYVELPDGAPGTTIYTDEDEINISVKQGDLLIMPAQYLHESKANESSGRKTVIAFNI